VGKVSKTQKRVGGGDGLYDISIGFWKGIA